jgi:hypothetical protein
MAAWRSGGFYPLPFKSALPAAVAPNRSLCVRSFGESVVRYTALSGCTSFSVRYQFHYFVGLYFIFGMVLNFTVLSVCTVLNSTTLSGCTYYSKRSIFPPPPIMVWFSV